MEIGPEPDRACLRITVLIGTFRMEITTFDEELISEIVTFWNDTFSNRRNFIPMTPALLEERILKVNTSQEQFDPERFLLARENADVIGLMHVGTYPEPICRLMYGEEWEGGDMGYVGLLAVHPEHRGNGVGSDLWQAGIEQISDTNMIDVDGQCLNPFYGNSLGPFQPLWGTTEGVSIRTDQDRTVSFLEKRGFEPTYEGISLELERSNWSGDGSGPADRTISVLDEAYPVLGEEPGERLPYPNAEDYFVVQLQIDGVTAGILSLYPFKDLDVAKWGVYEFRVAEEFREEGHEEAMLSRAVEELEHRGGEVIETLLLKELSEDTLAFYRDVGFEQVASWHIY